jgi:hypothetical protein
LEQNFTQTEAESEQIGIINIQNYWPTNNERLTEINRTKALLGIFIAIAIYFYSFLLLLLTQYFNVIHRTSPAIINI